MKLKSMIAMAVAGAFATSFAYAEGNKASSGSTSDKSAKQTPSFSQLDKNRDGSLSRAELKGSPWEKDFSKLDTNHDGKLSSQEFAAASSQSKSSATGGTSNSSTSKKY